MRLEAYESKQRQCRSWWDLFCWVLVDLKDLVTDRFWLAVKSCKSKSCEIRKLLDMPDESAAHGTLDKIYLHDTVIWGTYEAVDDRWAMLSLSSESHVTLRAQSFPAWQSSVGYCSCHAHDILDHPNIRRIISKRWRRRLLAVLTDPDMMELWSNVKHFDTWFSLFPVYHDWLDINSCNRDDITDNVLFPESESWL